MTHTGDSTLVTVVIPAYNAAKWIGETLASVAVQTVGPQRLEVIVVDDGSTDDSAGIAERFLATAGFQRWEVVRQSNSGPSAARNVGWRWARGEWIRFLDADDWIDPRLTEWQLDASAGCDERVAVVYCNWCYAPPDRSHPYFEKQIRPFVGFDSVADLLTPGNSIATGSQIYRRTWLAEVNGWDERLRRAEDNRLTLAVALCGGRFLKIRREEPGFYYRIHKGSLSNTPGSAAPTDIISFAKAIETECRTRDRLTPEVVQCLSDIYCCACRDLILYDWHKAMSVLQHIRVVNPKYRPRWSKKAALVTGWLGIKPTVFLAGLAAHIRRRNSLSILTEKAM